MNKGIERKKVQLVGKIDKLAQKHAALIEKASIHSSNAKSISCSLCGKRFVRADIIGEKCPGCGADLRSLPLRDKIASVAEDIMRAKQQLADLGMEI